MKLGDEQGLDTEGYPFTRRRPALVVLIALMLGIGLQRAFPLLFASLARALFGEAEGVSQWSAATPLVDNASLTSGTLIPLMLAALLLIAALMRQRAQRTLLAGMGVALIGFGYASYESAPRADHINALYPEDQHYLVLEGVIAQGTGSADQDESTFLGDELFAPVADRDLPYVFKQDDAPSSRFLLELERDITSQRDASGLVRCYLRGERELFAGERVRITAALAKPLGPTNPGEADLQQVYADQGIHTLAFVDAPSLIEQQGQTWRYPFQQAAERVRAWVSERVGSRLSPRHAALMNCLILGDRQALTPDLRNDFLHAGSLHLLVVSGLHVMVLGLVLLGVLRLLKVHPRWRMLAIALISLVYLVITGMHLSTIRAVSLIVLLALADLRKRSTDTINLLAVSALIVLAIDPHNLFSLGFVLSYASVLALSQLSSIIQPKRQPPKHGPAATLTAKSLRFSAHSIANSLIVLLATFPVVLRGWFLVAPVALIVNVLVFIPLAVLLGSALLLPLALIDGGAWIMAGWFEALLGILDVLVRWAAALPQSHAYLAAPPLWWIIAWYATLVGLLIAHRFRHGRRIVPATLVLLLGLLPWLGDPRPRSAELTFLDVRQGACAVLRTPGGGVAVLDCGSASRPHVGAWTIAPFLLSQGHERIDLLVLTHADADHINGAAHLIQRVEVAELWISEAFDDSEQGAEVLKWLTPRVGKVRVVSAGERYLFDGARLEILWPDLDFSAAISSGESPTNASSLVINVDLGYATALITGDAEDAATAGLGDSMPRCDVLLAPHHGSPFHHQRTLLERTQPAHVIISSRTGFSPITTLDSYAREATVWKTYESGAITLRATGTVDADDEPEWEVVGWVRE